jgi:hypothetical protein
MKGFRFFAFRIDPATGTAIEAAAAATKTSLSGWIRNAIHAALPEGASLPALPPSPPRHRAAAPEADVAALARLMSAVNRLNGAAVQLSKGLREAGHVPEHQAMESAIRDVSDLKAEGVRLFQRLQE